VKRLRGCHVLLMALGLMMLGGRESAMAFELQSSAFASGGEIPVKHTCDGQDLSPALLGEIAAQADPPDPESAQAHYSQALARAEELGMRPLVAHCHLGLGKLYRRTGKPDQAYDHLTTATTMYREMGMTFWPEKTEAALGSPPRNSP
jgi:hypothetical protein